MPAVDVGGITEEGLFNTNSLLAETERKMIESADEVIVVADHSKFGHSELAHLGPLSVIDKLVVDAELSSEWQERIQDNQVELVVAS